MRIFNKLNKNILNNVRAGTVVCDAEKGQSEITNKFGVVTGCRNTKIRQKKTNPSII